MQTNVSHEWINREELQRLQEDFCRATGVCAYCLDKDMRKITAVFGTAGQIRKLQELEERGLLKTLLERVEEGSLEEQAVGEPDEHGDRAAAVAVKPDGSVAVYWIVLRSVSGDNGRDTDFLHILDLLRDTSRIKIGRASCRERV